MNTTRRLLHHQGGVMRSERSVATSRREYIDVYKGLLMVLVAVGHSQMCSSGLDRFVYSFHMAAFFAVYGMSYSFEKRNQQFGNWHDLLRKKKKKATKIMIPYLIWALFYNTLTFGNLGRILYGSSQSLTEAGGLSSLWFLPSYYVAVLLFESFGCFARKISFLENRNWLICVISVLLFGTAGYLLPKLKETGYPWGVNIGIMACSFFGAGYLINLLFNKVRFLRNTFVLIAISMACFFIVYFTYSLNITESRHVSLARSSFGNPFLFVLDTISGMICILSAALVISKHGRLSKKAFCYIGTNTMGIFLTHKNLQYRINSLLKSSGINNTAALLMGVVITIIICSGITWLILRICPVILGESGKKKAESNSLLEG